MKRLIIIFGFFALTLGAKSQDTIQMDDLIYNIIDDDDAHPYMLAYRSSSFPGDPIYNYYYSQQADLNTYWIYIQKLISRIDWNVEKIYGLAITADNIPPREAGKNIAPTLGLYDHLHATCSYYTVSSCSMQMVDTFSITDYSRQLYFKYDVHDSATNSSPTVAYVVPSYEYYFDRPYSVAELADSICVALVWPWERKFPYEEWASSIADSLWFKMFFRWSVTAETPDCRMLSMLAPYSHPNCPGYYSSDSIVVPGYYAFVNFRDGIYPITGLRCTTPQLWLEGRGDRTATLGWWQATAGEEYQLSLSIYGSDPDSGMIVTTTDTFFTFTDLDPNELLEVRVRKSCRYTTPGYDTVVWSEWSKAVAFRALGIGEVTDGVDFSLTPNPAHVRVGVALPGEAVGGRLTLCDLTGRELASYSVATTDMELDISTLSAGAYILKLVTPRGISTRRLLVE